MLAMGTVLASLVAHKRFIMGTQISRLSIPPFQVVAGAAAERFLGRFLTRGVWALLTFHSCWQILRREEPYKAR